MRFNRLQTFFLGMIFTFILLKVFFLFLPIEKVQVTYMIQGSLVETVTAIGTLLAAFVALVIAIWGKRLSSIGDYKSDIKILKSLENIQENTNGVKQGHTRLIFKNEGKVTAEDVEVYVDNIYDNDNSRLDFIAVPLSWTHDDRSRRNFHPKQFGYLDFCRIDDISQQGSVPKLVLVAGGGIPTYQEIKPITTKVRIIVFQKSGEIKKFMLKLNWIPAQAYVKVQRIYRLQ